MEQLAEFFLCRISTGTLLRELFDRKYLDMLDSAGESSEIEGNDEMVEIRTVLNQQGVRALKYVDLFIPQTSVAAERIVRIVLEPAEKVVSFFVQIFMDSCSSRLLFRGILKRSHQLSLLQSSPQLWPPEYLENISYIDIFMPLAYGKVVRIRLTL
jgi:hypothetical protein